MATKIAKGKAKRPKLKVAQATPSAEKKLTDREARFVAEYCIDLNVQRAALVAGFSETMARTKCYLWVSDSKLKPNVHAAIKRALDEVSKRTEIDQDRIRGELWNMATADPNSLVEYHRNACRFCYGTNHKYQYTPNEMEQARLEHGVYLLQAAANGIKLSAEERQFNPKGGLGFDPRKRPNPDCPECFGQGEGHMFVKDTRDLTPQSKALYAGVERGKDGLKMKMHDKAGALQLLMRHAGMLNDKIKLQGDPENPLVALIKQVSGTGLSPVQDADGE